MNWQEKFSKRSKNMKPSTVREILKLTQQPDIISFAGGLPSPKLFPIERIQDATNKVLENHGTEALQYSTTEGYSLLREWIASRMPHTTVENVQILSGSQQGLDLVGKCLLNAGDTVAVASPTYMGALRAFDAYEVNYASIACDEEGFLPDSLEEVLGQKPKLLYVIPNFDNPRGVSTSLERRRLIVELARKYDVPIFEDDPYGQLRFEGEVQPSLYELAPDITIYSSTFSKIMVPGIRLAWMITDPVLLEPIVRAKQAADLHTPIFTQYITYEVAKDGYMDKQIAQVQDYYKKQQNYMLTALEKYFPSEVSYTKPEGGMFLWVTMPDGTDSIQMLEQAVKQKVAYVPGEPFHANGGGKNTFRLSYSVATEEQIDSGIARLGKVLENNIKTLVST